ncbi:tRNA1(Val) (adenine(37)-N6)-methyltransferase [Thalassospira povalilytica]|uniref:tRNA1(Val) (adenine(37)-N6)-methyltransferase n=1 Tax=Thalassospira povalilytica TaxID=732237 RepID=UPI001D186F29|nr:methyltransferase [Thalassospira povalilytica]MCC4242321.1 methyltransferase [Thalassospira povalilytica]
MASAVAAIDVPDFPEARISHDYLLGGAVTLKQPVDGYRAAVDAVLLAASVSINSRRDEKILDVGAAVGSAGLCVAKRLEDAKVTGVELQDDLYALFCRNVVENELAGRVNPVHGDINDASLPLVAESFDQVISNPPYYAGGTRPANESRATAHQEGSADLKDWIGFCLKMVRQKGRITLVHRADHLDRIIGLLHGRAGDMTVYPIWSKADSDAPLRVIVSARKGVASPLCMRRGIVLHDAAGAYLRETDILLRNPLPLPGF